MFLVVPGHQLQPWMVTRQRNLRVSMVRPRSHFHLRRRSHSGPILVFVAPTHRSPRPNTIAPCRLRSNQNARFRPPAARRDVRSLRASSHTMLLISAYGLTVHIAKAMTVLDSSPDFATRNM